MTILRLFLLALLAVCAPAFSSSCLEAPALLKLDADYEQAVRTGDTDFLAQLLSDEFIWVHNLAVEIETKPVLLARLQKAGYKQPKARTSENLTVRRLDNTAIVTGYTTVEQFNPDGETTRASRYHFMRTYVLVDGQCQLLANKTVKVWSSNPDDL
jgi:hypothetical protein